MEKKGLLSSIITQNIDGFHSSVGSIKVLELHGSVKRNHCMKCHKFYNDDIVFNSSGIPKCSCGGIIKPDVVLYEEGLDDDVINEAIEYAGCGVAMANAVDEVKERADVVTLSNDEDGIAYMLKKLEEELRDE